MRLVVETTVYLPEGLKRRLEQPAGEKGRKEAELIREAVQRLVDAEARAPLDLPLLSSLGDPTLAELDSFVATRAGVDAEATLLARVAAGSLTLAECGAADVGTALALIERYRSLSIGLADASLVVLADRDGTNRLLTLDERHFRAVRPLGGGAFRLLPTDA